MWGDGTPWEAIPPNLRQSMIDKIDVVDAGTPALHKDAHGLLGLTVWRITRVLHCSFVARAAFHYVMCTQHWSN